MKIFRNTFILLFLFLLMNGCRSTSRSPETNAPKPEAESSYPILLTQDETRRERALEVWNKLTREQNITNATAPMLHPVTSTLIGIPSNQNLLLPKVGEGVPMREDESRESLRRFLKDGGALLCGYSQQLSLIERTDEEDGTKLAVYQQQIFRYPLRGDFGKVEIVFMASRRIVQIKSMCLPNSDSLQRTVAELKPDNQINIIEKIKGQTILVKNKDGSVQNLTINDEKEITIQELVIYSQSSNTNSMKVELYLAWAVKLSDKAFAYHDSQTGNLLAATEINAETRTK
jgi:hypothetical protein